MTPNYCKQQINDAQFISTNYVKLFFLSSENNLIGLKYVSFPVYNVRYSEKNGIQFNPFYLVTSPDSADIADTERLPALKNRCGFLNNVVVIWRQNGIILMLLANPVIAYRRVESAWLDFSWWSDETIRAMTMATVFNFTINHHVKIKYFETCRRIDLEGLGALNLLYLKPYILFKSIHKPIAVLDVL